MQTQSNQAQRSARRCAFSISGEFITQMAREHLTNGDHQRALRFLTESLDGLTVDMAVSILKAEKRLTGNSGTDDIDLDVEDPEDEAVVAYKSTMQRLWRGIFRFNSKLYQPYGKVTSWGREDYQYSLAVSRGTAPFVHTAGNQELKLARSAYYAEDPSEDLVVGTADGVYLCRCVWQEPPFWHPVHTADPVIAVTDYVAQHRLPEFGAANNPPLHQERPSPARGAAADTEDLQDRLAESNARVAHIAEDVRKRAAETSGFMDLPLYADERCTQVERLVKVPKAAFLHWAFRGVDPERFALDLPQWHPHSESGLKMGGDDPFHTDWMLGGGFNLEADYDRTKTRVQQSADHLRFTLREAALSANCTVLSGRGQAFGRVVHPKPGEPVDAGDIAVIPFAGPAYQLALETACRDGRGAVICEVGGKLAHLAIVGRERDARLVMQEGALTRYIEGSHVSVDCDAHSIQAHAFE